MPFPPIGGTGTGGGFTLGPPQNVFTGATRAAAETARDTYFTANPTNLAEYNADTSLNVRLEYSVSGNAVALFQVRNSAGNAWIDNSSAVGVRGDDGADGMDGAGLPVTNLPANRIPMLNPTRTEFTDSGIRQLSSGELLMPSDTGFEAASLRIGDISTLHEANSFLRLSNSQFPAVRFDLIDARSRPTAASNRPRQFYLTEAENDFVIQAVDTETITTNPLSMNYTVTLNAQTNAFRFRTAAAMTNVRVTVSYATGNQGVIKYLPSKAAVLDGSGGYDFTLGENTVSFPDSPFRQLTGDQVTVLVEADNISFLGNTTGFPYLVAVVQRGEFRDLAHFADIQTTEQIQDIVAAMFTGGTHNGISFSYDDADGFIDATVTGGVPQPGPSITNFSINIPTTVNIGTNLNDARTIQFTTSNTAQIASMELVVTTGTNQTLTVPSADGSHSQSVTLAGINTSAAGTVVFQIRATTTGNVAIMSNSQTVTIRAVSADEQAYYGVRATNDFATVVTALLTPVDVQPPGTQYTISGSWPATQFIGILEPTDRPITSIVETAFNQETLSTWSRTASARTINGQVYDLLTQRNNGPTGTFEFRVRHG